MLDKMDFAQIVRYFFSGCIAVFCCRIIEGDTIEELCNSLCIIAWTASPTYLMVLVISFVLIGYIFFNLYRGIIYEKLLVRLKGALGKRFRYFHTYREFISYLWGKRDGREIRSIEAEKLYVVIRTTLNTDFYKGTSYPITTSLHFFYYSGIALFLSAFSRIVFVFLYGFLANSVCIYPWLYILLLFAMFILICTLCMDFHFEKTELLLFEFHRGYVMDAIRKIKYGSYWQEDSSGS